MGACLGSPGCARPGSRRPASSIEAAASFPSSARKRASGDRTHTGAFKTSSDEEQERRGQGASIAVARRRTLRSLARNRRETARVYSRDGRGRRGNRKEGRREKLSGEGGGGGGRATRPRRPVLPSSIVVVPSAGSLASQPASWSLGGAHPPGGTPVAHPPPAGRRGRVFCARFSRARSLRRRRRRRAVVLLCSRRRRRRGRQP